MASAVGRGVWASALGSVVVREGAGFDAGPHVRGVIRALEDAARAHDAAAAETAEEWVRMVLERCAIERRRLARELSGALAKRDGTARPAQQSSSEAAVLEADRRGAHDQALSTLRAREWDVDQRLTMALACAPSPELGHLLAKHRLLLRHSREVMSAAVAGERA